MDEKWTLLAGPKAPSWVQRLRFGLQRLSFAKIWPQRLALGPIVFGTRVGVRDGQFAWRWAKLGSVQPVH